MLSDEVAKELAEGERAGTARARREVLWAEDGECFGDVARREELRRFAARDGDEGFGGVVQMVR